MYSTSKTPANLLQVLWSHRTLIQVSVKREVLGRYKGSILGLFWSFFNPLLMLCIYTFVFSEIFHAKWTTATQSKTEFALVLFSGLIVFNLFSESINRAPSLIASNPNFVKKVIYPIEILPVTAYFASLYHALISLIVWILAYSIFIGVPHITVLLLPLVLIPFSLFTLGINWILASLGVYIRDLSQIISLLTTVLMFLSPVFYPSSALPTFYREAMALNPLTLVIELTRQLLYWGTVPTITELATLWISSLLASWLGLIWFQRTRKGFSDVL